MASDAGLSLMGSRAVLDSQPATDHQILQAAGSAIGALKEHYDRNASKGEVRCFSKEVSFLRGDQSQDMISRQFGPYLDALSKVRSHECIVTFAHGDMSPGNWINSSDGVHLIDFEYCHVGCLYDDLGKLVTQSGWLENWGPTKH